MCNNQDGSSIQELLNVILILQQNACPNNGLDSCDRPILGGGANCLGCNTRPIMIYTCCPNNTALSMPTTKDATDNTDASSVFRIEKLEGDCATFRVLEANPDATSTSPWLTTNSVFTICLDCICVVRCLSDTYVDGVC